MLVVISVVMALLIGLDMYVSRKFRKAIRIVNGKPVPPDSTVWSEWADFFRKVEEAEVFAESKKVVDNRKNLQ